MADDRKQLLSKSRHLRSKMRQLGPMIQGSVIFRRVKCGKPNCKCAKGHLHDALCITYKEQGKTKTVYVDKSMQADAFLWSRNYKLFKKFLKEHSAVNLEILRSRK